MLMNIGESEHKDGYWESAAKSSIIAELVLLLISTYYMGRTADFAAQKGFYLASSNIGGWPRTMYAGALFSLITVFQCTMLLGFTIVWKRAKKDGDIIKWLEKRIPARYFFFGLLFLASTSWLASWFFWVGYVMTAGDL
ncbi:hypothetical protein B0O99DRAFT_177835 [Bisporella sp. PMI_857]|nr:hypothetical protein B0O99DRAFT_177835 [Bisporella sp. PMI_857]